jgi:hypothetical protein
MSGNPFTSLRSSHYGETPRIDHVTFCHLPNGHLSPSEESEQEHRFPNEAIKDSLKQTLAK